LKNFTKVTKNQCFTVPSHHKAVQQNKMVMFSEVPVFAEISVTCVQLLVLRQKIKMQGALYFYRLSKPTGRK
jgi:hypothetical protein